jgi:hypothetical protein
MTEKLFLPYLDDQPVVTEIKGHRLVIVSEDQQDLRDSLEMLGADEVLEIDLRDSFPDAAETLAEEVEASAVFTPEGVSIGSMILSLQESLSWIQ